MAKEPSMRSLIRVLKFVLRNGGQDLRDHLKSELDFMDRQIDKNRKNDKKIWQRDRFAIAGILLGACAMWKLVEAFWWC